MKHFPRLAIFICWLVAFLPKLGAFTPSKTDSDIRWQVGLMVESFTPTAFREPQTIGSSGSLGYNERGEVSSQSTASDTSSLEYYHGQVSKEEHTAGVLAGQTLIREYDDHDRLKTIRLPGDVSISYTYNDDCTLYTVTTAGGVGGTWSNYDPVSGNAKTLVLGPLTANSEYNGLEQLLSHSNATTGHTYVYDDYRYDGDGHCYYRNTPNGSCTYEYDGNGWLDDASNPHFHYTKDEVGRLTDTAGSGGYAEDYRPKKRLNSTSVEIFGSVAPGTGSSVAINNSAVTVDTTTGLYNQVYTAGTGWSLYTVRGTVSGAGNGGSNAVAEQSYQVYQPPAVEDLGYDLSGNRSQDARWSYSWNDRDQLTWITEGSPATGYQSTNVYCAYDVLGRRVEKKVENGTLITKRTTTLWDGWLPMLDIDYDGAGAETARRYYSWGPDVSGKLDGAAGIGGLLEIMELRPGFSPTVSLVMNDGIGNIIGLVDKTSGARVASYQYGPFGELVNAYGERAGSCPFRFQTKRYDEETGLYYFGKRYYDPKTQAWLSRDPLREGGGINLYAYCSNDPVGNFDPVGLGLLSTVFGTEDMGEFAGNYASAWYEHEDDDVDNFFAGVGEGSVSLGQSVQQLATHPIDSGGAIVSGTYHGLVSIGNSLGSTAYQAYADPTHIYDNALNGVNGALNGIDPNQVSKGIGKALPGTEAAIVTGPVVGKLVRAAPALAKAAKGVASGIKTIKLPKYLLSEAGSIDISGSSFRKAAKSISPAAIRFSQSSVNEVEEIAASMRSNGWKGAPIDVVQMSDGGLTAFDNTRVLAASRANINVQAIIREATEVFPEGRWTPKSGVQPTTWADAIAARIQQQNRLYRRAYPNGSFVTGSTQ